jgi:hypothetical protein
MRAKLTQSLKSQSNLDHLYEFTQERNVLVVLNVTSRSSKKDRCPNIGSFVHVNCKAVIEKFCWSKFNSCVVCRITSLLLHFSLNFCLLQVYTLRYLIYKPFFLCFRPIKCLKGELLGLLCQQFTLVDLLVHHGADKYKTG